MYKGFRLLALLDLASIDLQTRFRKEKVKKKKNEEHHPNFDPSCTFGCWVL